MHGARPPHSTGAALRAVIASGVVAVGSLAAPPDAVVSGGLRVDSGAEPSEPHLLEGDVADVILSVRGSSICSGTPITGTRYVVTAAHCVLDGAGELVTPTVVRDGVDYTPRLVLLDLRYHETPLPQLDAAVLVMDGRIPGSSATLGDTLPTHGLVTLAGFQPIDTDGTLLRGISYHDRPIPKGVTGGVVVITSMPAGCVEHASSVEIAFAQLKVPCGLVPGASGGGLFTEHGGEPVLLGVTSTVAFDLSSNGLAPLSAVHELLDHPGEYTHVVPDGRPTATAMTITRS